MKLINLILFAACATPFAIAETVTVDFIDIENTMPGSHISVPLNDDISIDCPSGQVNNNLLLTSGTYMTVTATQGFAISEIKFNFRPANVQDGTVSDWNAYKFDTESHLSSPDYDSFIISPNGNITNPDYDTMIWSADGTPLNSVSFRNMRDNNFGLSIESVDVTYSATTESVPTGLPYSVSGVEFDAQGWFHGPAMSICNYDGKAYTLCHTEGEGTYEVYLQPVGATSESSDGILVASYPETFYNAVSIPDGEYTLAVKNLGNAVLSSLSVSPVPATWPAGLPTITSVKPSDKIWHNIEVEINFPTTSWNGEALATPDINYATFTINGKASNLRMPSEEILEGTALYSWTSPTGEWSFGGEWRYAYTCNMMSMPNLGGELTLAPFEGDSESGYVFECQVQGANYYNQFSTINKEMNLRGNMAGMDFPLCSARPSSMEYSYGWFIMYTNENALRVNQQVDCWLILPVLNLTADKEYEISFENEGITSEKEPVVAILPTSDELTFDNMLNAANGVNDDTSPEGVYAATISPQESGSHFIGLHLCNNGGDNPYGPSATITKISVKEKIPAAINTQYSEKTTEAYYDIMGRKVNNPAKGSIVVKVSNGNAQKIIVK